MNGFSALQTVSQQGAYQKESNQQTHQRHHNQSHTGLQVLVSLGQQEARNVPSIVGSSAADRERTSRVIDCGFTSHSSENRSFQRRSPWKKQNLRQQNTFTNQKTCTTTQTTTTIVLRPFVWDYPGEPVPEETCTHPPSWSSSDLCQLLPYTTIHSVLPVQTACLAISLHNLSPHPFWSTSWPGALHLFPHISSPNQCLLFATTQKN